MASRYTLDLYEKLILPRLADGPKSLVQLDVPHYALEALKHKGLVYMRTHKFETTTAKWGIQMWYRSDYKEQERLDCATMTFEGIA